MRNVKLLRNETLKPILAELKILIWIMQHNRHFVIKNICFDLNQWNERMSVLMNEKGEGDQD